MRRLLWVTLMPILVLVIPWGGAWVTHGGRQAAQLAAAWVGCAMLAAFVASGPGIMGLLGLAVFQLGRTPWRPPPSRSRGGADGDRVGV